MLTPISTISHEHIKNANDSAYSFLWCKILDFCNTGAMIAA
jgi:hypothetical protein